PDPRRSDVQPRPRQRAQSQSGDAGGLGRANHYRGHPPPTVAALGRPRRRGGRWTDRRRRAGPRLRRAGTRADRLTFAGHGSNLESLASQSLSAPFTEGAESFVERRARFGEGVLDLRRHLRVDLTVDEAVGLHLTQVLSEHLLADAG